MQIRPIRRNTILFVASFLLAGIVNVFFMGIWPFISGSTLIYILLAGAWGVSVRTRILDHRARGLLEGVAACIASWMILRLCKYQFVGEVPGVNRYIWYAFYLFIVVLPLLCFFLAVCSMTAEDERPLKKWRPLVGIGSFLILLVMTNDFHFLAFSFSYGVDYFGTGEYQREILYYIILLWCAGLVVATLVIMFRKCNLPQCRRQIWVPLLPIIIGSAYMVYYLFHGPLEIHTNVVYQFQEILSFMIIGALEGCIRIGLLPSNSGYEEIFARGNFMARIMDRNNNVVLASDRWFVFADEEEWADEQVAFNKGFRRNCYEIPEGHFLWMEDISSISRINADLEETVAVLQSENEVIEEENRLLVEKTRLETMNRLYDSIAFTVNPQILKLERLLEKEKINISGNLPEATFLNAYIKRRSNLMLLSQGRERMKGIELYLAVKESLDYLRLSDIATVVDSQIDEKEWRNEQIFAAYDCFEEIVEKSYSCVSAVLVNLYAKEEFLVLRMTMELKQPLEGVVWEELQSKYSEQTEILSEEEMAVLTVSFGRKEDAE